MNLRRSLIRPLPLLLASALLGCGGGPTGPVTGSLAVAVTGLPAGAPAALSVTGPGGFARTVTGSETIPNLAPGSYALTASPVTFSGLAYDPTPATQAVTVSQSDTPAAAAVDYAATPAGLAVSIGGLPSGTPADVTVTGPGGFSHAITATQTFTGLAAGTYTITANTVSSCSADYTATPPSQTASVVAGATASASVTYSGAAPGALNLCIAGMYLTQSVQTYAGTVPLVRNRDGLLRVFVTANQSNVAAPAVRVQFYSSGVLVQTSTINAPGVTTPLSPDESSLSSSWNLPVPKALIQPNLSILADVDPLNSVAEGNEGDNSFPASATPLAMDVRSTSTFNVTFVPIFQSANGRLGNVTAGNKDQYLTQTMKVHPLAAYTAAMRVQLTTAQPAVDASNSNNAWTLILGELNAARTADGSTQNYYGVLNPTYSSGVAGIGYVGGPSALGWDKLPSASWVAAHEWGHNWGRSHAPCGNPTGIDPFYPHPDGSTGVYGLDVATATLQPPTDSDIMGYCNPEWISDYTYVGVLNYRLASPDVTTAFSQAMQPCLLVWGHIENGEPVLEPAFEIATRPNLPDRGGDYTLEGHAADGSRMFSFSFAPAEVADDPQQGKIFAFAVPLAADRASRLATLRLAGRGREAITRRSAALPQAGARAPLAMRRTGTGQVALTWDAAAHPMLLVRDGGTGQVLSFARGGSIQLPAGNANLSVGFSDGVGSSEMRVAVPSR